jgi:hypothetical protein
VKDLNHKNEQRLAALAAVDRLEQFSAALQTELRCEVAALNARVFDLVESGAEAAAYAETVSLQVTPPLA